MQDLVEKFQGKLKTQKKQLEEAVSQFSFIFKSINGKIAF